MKKHRRHIIAIVVTALISVTLYAARTNSDRLSLLQPLLEYNHPFSPDAPVDSIIAWEKLLEPELQKEQQYPLLFQINLLTVQALITEGNISLAINQANQMYQKAREMDYPLGIALALHAIGNTYLSSSTPQVAIKSYKEALEIIQKLPHANQYIKTILSQFILTKLNYHQMTDIEDNIRELESVINKDTNPQDDFHLVYCQAFYRIQMHHLPEALNYIRQTEQISRQHQYPYFHLMIKYLYSRYYTESKEYTQALTTLDELLSHTKAANSYRSLQVLKDRAHILTLMGNSKEACEAYEIFNTYKDSLDAMNYIRQINELHTLYQIDKNELDNLNRQKTIMVNARSLEDAKAAAAELGVMPPYAGVEFVDTSPSYEQFNYLHGAGIPAPYFICALDMSALLTRYEDGDNEKCPEYLFEMATRYRVRVSYFQSPASVKSCIWSGDLLLCGVLSGARV